MARSREPRLARAIYVMRSEGHTITERPTEGAGSAREIAADAVRGGADLIVVAGGDGTINEAINGMVHSEVPLTILPAGTANVLAVELGLGVSLRRAAKRISEMIAARVSVGLLRPSNAPERHFLLMAGAGLDADIVNNVHPGLKKHAGKLAYWLAGFSQIARKLPQMQAEANDWSCRTGFALASRVRNYGGDLEIAKSVTLLDNDFEVVAFEGEDAMAYLKYLGGLLVGNIDTVPGVHMLRAHHLALQPENGTPIPVQVDGEPAGQLPATVETIPAALTLLVPPGLYDRYRL